MRFICICLLAAVMHSQPIFAQQKSASYDLWWTRSQVATADLVKDSVDLTAPERALLWAKLGQEWWPHDAEKARAWMVKCVEFVEAVPNKETAAERRQRLGLVRSLLRIIANLDQTLSARLVALLTQEAEQEAKTGSAPNTDGLIDAAIFLAEKEPRRAAELGAMALRIGSPTQIMELIGALHHKNPGLADALLTETLAAVRQSLNSELLNSLAHYAFPALMQPGADSATSAPDGFGLELLKVDAVYIQANPINDENRAPICLGIAAFIAPVLVQFDRLLPQQAVIVRQSINQCRPAMSPLLGQRVDDAVRDQPLNTVDDLLKAGDDAKDWKVRTVYQYRAATLAKQHNDIDRSLKILDSMGSEARDLMGGSWEACRWQWAAVAALRHFTSGDVYGIRLILNSVPADLQPFAKLEFIRQLPAKRDKDTDPTLEFLGDARTGLRRSSLSEAEKSDGYLGMLPLTVRYLPAEATSVLREGVAALNRVEEKIKKTGNDEELFLSGAGFAKILTCVID